MRDLADIHDLIDGLTNDPMPAMLQGGKELWMVLDRWLAMLARLYSVVEAVGRPDFDEPLDLDDDSRQELQRLRLDAPVQKMRYHVVATQIRRRLVQAVPGVDIDAGLSNRAGFVGGFIHGAGPLLGWQLQQQQFRLAFVVPDRSRGYGRTAKAREARYQHARRYAAYFDFSAVRELVSTAGPERPSAIDAQPLGFQRFDPNFACLGSGICATPTSTSATDRL